MRFTPFLVFPLLFSQAGALWSQQTASITFTEIPPGGYVFYTFYISPYTASINGVSTLVISDDFEDDTSIPESYSAAATNLSSLTVPSATVRWSAGWSYNTTSGWMQNLTQAQAYTAAAYLATQILQAAAAGNVTLQGYVSFALWSLFDGPVVASWLNQLGGMTDLSNVLQYLSAAEVAAQSLSPTSFSNVTVYTYNGGSATCGGSPCPSLPPMELLVVSQTGAISVTTNLAAAAFTIAGPATFSGSGASATFNNAPAGAYTITFGSVPGYTTPTLQTQTLSVGETITFSGIYQATYVGGTGTTTNPTASTNEPINTATGNYYLSRTDLAVPGKGLPFAFTRSYNSLDSYSGPLGAGWTHSYNILLNDSGTAVTIKEGDGHSVQFAATGGGAYVPSTPGLFDALRKNADGTYTLTRKSQTQVNFTASGKLSTIVDRNGNSQRFGYDGSGNLIAAADTAGRVFAFSYDGSNRLITLTDPVGRTWQYAYDATSNLISVRDAAGGVTQYAYDANHRMSSAADARGVVFLQNTYDARGRVITQKNARGFATTLGYNVPSTGTTTIADPLGNATQHVYDGSLRIVRVIDAKGGTVSYAYDVNNDRTSVTNQNGKTTTFAYDTQGNTTRITDPLGNATAFTYDAKNNLLTATNPKGSTTSFGYDGKGNLASIRDALGNTTAFTYDSSGLLLSKTDARGNATGFSYDSPGDLTGITDPVGNKTALGYDGISRLLSVRDANGHTATSAYDVLSRLTKVADALGDQTQFGYDPIGNLLKITDANGNATSYAYDGTNNLATVTDAAGNITRYGYDANNSRTAFTNAKGNTTGYTYDALNRLSLVTDPLLLATSYAYDAVGNVVATTDANGKTNQFGYDALNRLANIAYADGSAVAYSYDPDGNRTAMADAHGTTTYGYDALDRLTTVTNPGGKVVAYAYDAVGNRQSLRYPDGTTASYAYDRANRLASVTDWLGRPTAYAYDSAGNLTGTVYPNRAQIAFSYDTANRLTGVVNSALGLPLLNLGYTLDRVGNCTSMAVDGVATTFAYDPLNQLLSAQLGSLKTTWTYDPVGNRLKEVALLGTTAYAYDADDRLLTAGATTFTYDRNGNQIAKATGKATVSYAYDAANRLTAVTGPGIASRFAYDGDGNRVSQTTSQGTYAYVSDVATALPVALNEQGPDGSIAYAYGLGLVEEYNPSFNYFYQQDGLGSVVALTDSKGVPQAVYAYDSWGNPLLSVTDNVGTRNKFRFTGEALDPGTGLYYLRARYYDPSVGRFTSKDRFVGIAGLPLTINKFVYVLNRPLALRDPSGLSAEDTSGTQKALGPVVSTSADLRNTNTTISIGPLSTTVSSVFNSKLASVGEDILDLISTFTCFVAGVSCEGLFPVPGLPLLLTPTPAMPGSPTFQANTPFKPIG